MQLPNLSNLSDENLLAGIENLRGNENQVTTDIISHLAEINSRGIFRDEGYSSLFKYCVEALGYSEGAAYRRIQAAHALAQSPEIYELIKDGKLSLSALSAVSKVMTEENAPAVLEQVKGATQREAALIAAQNGAPEKPKRACIRARKVVTSLAKSNLELPETDVAQRFSFSFEVTKEVKELYEQAKEIAGPCPMEEVIEKALRAYVQKHRPSKPAKQTSPVEGNAAGRYVPRPVRREVIERDGGQCTYIAPDGKRCTERCGLQFDHIKPFANGRLNTVDNLRLFCPAHNQLYAEKCFGRDFMLQQGAQRPIL